MTQLQPGRVAYSVREVAVALGISGAATYKMIQRGKLSHVCIGGRKFIPASLMRVLLGGQTVTAHEVQSESVQGNP